MAKRTLIRKIYSSRVLAFNIFIQYINKNGIKDGIMVKGIGSILADSHRISEADGGQVKVQIESGI